jgi:NodT family efflux transporter outer membrane factor (OMF) lipoprotein
MFLKKRLNLFALFFLGIFFFFSSCKVTEAPQMPEVPDLPQSFRTSSDSISAGDITWRNYFNDPYLLQLIDTALTNNFDLRTAVQRIEMARVQYQLREGAMLPSLDARYRLRSGDLYDNLFRGTIYGDRNVIRQTRNHFLGFVSTWEADLWGKLKNRKKAAYARFMASDKARQLITTSIVAEVARLYYELLGLDNELQTIEKNIEFQQIALELIEIQKIGGRATELAVQQFEAQLLRTRSLRYEKIQSINEVENQLNLLLGRFPQPIERGESILQQDLPEVVSAGLPSELLLRRPDIRQAELELIAAEADLEAARAEFLPSLTLTPYFGLHTRTITSLFTTPESLVLGMLGGITAPIFQQNQIQGQYDQSVAENLTAYYNYQQSIQTAFQEVLTNLQSLENLENAYELKSQETEVLLNAVNTSNDLFAAGFATYLEVITAQERVLEAELDRTTTRKELFLALVDLYRSLGGGWQN